MSTFDTLFQSDYFVQLLGVVLPCVSAGLLLPFIPWAVGALCSSLFQGIRSVL